MTFTKMDFPLSPFANPDNVISRVGGWKCYPCPKCSEPVPFKYKTSADGSTCVHIYCPNCGTSKVAIDRIDENDHVHFIDKDTGEPYDAKCRVNAIRSKLQSEKDLTHTGKARLMSDLAWEGFLTGMDNCCEMWHEAVGEYRIASWDGEDFSDALVESLYTMIRVKYEKSVEDNIDAVELLHGIHDAPRSPKECLVWLWYSQRILDDHDCYEEEVETAIDMRKTARTVLEGFSEEELSDTPYLKALDLLWEYRSLGPYEERTNEEEEVLYDRASKEFLSVVEKGIEPEPEVLDLYLKESALGISFAENIDEAMDTFESSSASFGRYSDLISARAVYYRIMLDLLDEIVMPSLLFRNPNHRPTGEQANMLIDSIRKAEMYVSLRDCGRTLIDGYTLLTRMTADYTVAEVACSYADTMIESGIGDPDIGKYAKVLMEFLRRDNKKWQSSQKNKPSKKDRVKLKRQEHIAKRK